MGSSEVTQDTKQTHGRALVVEDEEPLRRAYGRMLEGAGFTTILAASGREAMEAIEKDAVDVVVSDINMPNMNGFELLRQIRAQPEFRTLPVLMVTAEAKKEDIVNAAQCGASGYIVKPFTKATLEEKVAKIISKMQPQ